MQPAAAARPPPSSAHEELAQWRLLTRAVDEVLEQCLRERMSLAQTLRRLFPVVLAQTGAVGVAVTTRNEALVEQTFHTGEFGGAWPGTLLQAPHGVRRVEGGTLVSQTLDVAGETVGHLGLFLAGDHTSPELAGPLAGRLDAIAEQLDSVLLMLHTSRQKHQLILDFNTHLSNPVFEAGMDEAVRALAQRVRLPGFVLLYRDSVRRGVLHHRTWRNGVLLHASPGEPDPRLTAVLRAHGEELLEAGDARLAEALQVPRGVEAVLVTGHRDNAPLGRILVYGDEDGISSWAADLVRVLASTLSQRLVDYHRERIHLSESFSPAVVDELLQDPEYATHHLASRDEEVGILFADINGFTRLCEQGLESPTRIARFVDAWSERVVELLWEHGGVFDKMVGDCVIGLFGPPFFRTSRRERAERLVRSALDIQAYTASLGAEAGIRDMCLRAGQPGLGVAIGLNLANAYCGFFGPNRDYTGFSTGMNQTARLQSLGGFRETLLMAPVVSALQGTSDPRLAGLVLGPLEQTQVKNVQQPLRYHRLVP